ncbi:MAG: hypothetical protein PVSMB1_18760 [Gemmatimonadaceae bacterium]
MAQTGIMLLAVLARKVLAKPEHMLACRIGLLHGAWLYRRHERIFTFVSSLSRIERALSNTSGWQRDVP